MMERGYKLFLTYNATSLMLVTFWINNRYYITFIKNSPIIISDIMFILIASFLTWLSLKAKGALQQDSIEDEIVEIENANNSFLPTYLGYFFVALSISSLETMVFVFGMVFIFTYVAQVQYFNPVFLCFGYQFYNVTTKGNVKVFIISKRRMRVVKDLKFNNLRRINDFTYIDHEEE